MKFSAFKIDPKLIEDLNSKGFINLSPIQEKALPAVLANKSSLVKAPTGSGKTLCYLVPILNDLNLEEETQAVIILPTVLLCKQVYFTLKSFFTYKKSKVDLIVDGTSKNIDKYRGQIVITTPEQFLFNKNKINFKNLKRIIIDEGDMILFDGFIKPLEEILDLNKNASVFLFTASIDEHLNTLVKKFIKASNVIETKDDLITSKNVKHYLVDIKHVDLIQALANFIKAKNPYKALIFTSKKAEVSKLQKGLKDLGINALATSSELSKREQKQVIKEFALGKSNILIGSDLLSRGFDIPNITDVISVDLPYDLTYYFHRAGRTGRFDKLGSSFVFYNDDQTIKVKELIKKGVNFTFLTLKGTELKKERNLSEIGKKPKKNNLYLEQEIRKKIYKLRSKKVKPNYKKKIKRMIERVKQKHKEDIIKTNLSKRNKNEETNFSFIEKNYPGKKKR